MFYLYACSLYLFILYFSSFCADYTFSSLLIRNYKFSLSLLQMFHLMPGPTGFYVLNDIFRLNYAWSRIRLEPPLAQTLSGISHWNDCWVVFSLNICYSIWMGSVERKKKKREVYQTCFKFCRWWTCLFLLSLRNKTKIVIFWRILGFQGSMLLGALFFLDCIFLQFYSSLLLCLHIKFVAVWNAFYSLLDVVFAFSSLGINSGINFLFTDA